MAARKMVLQRLHSSTPRSTEDTAFVALALRDLGFDSGALIGGQLSSGAWTVSPAVGPPNAFQTSLGVLALRSWRDPSATGAARRGIQWLSSLEPTEIHWLWKWKFRFFDRQVRFDPDKFGWPWVEGTVSWVAPTALTILAFEAWQFKSARIEWATAMLLDRACPSGGWNAGNSVVFGVAVDPHPDFTAMALLALLGRTSAQADSIRKAIEYLSTKLMSSRSAYSLAWGVMALSAYGDPGAAQLRYQLEAVLTIPLLDKLSVRVLAMAALALEEPAFTFREFPL